MSRRIKAEKDLTCCHLPGARVWTIANSCDADKATDLVRTRRYEEPLSNGSKRSKGGRHGAFFYQDPQLGNCVIKEYGVPCRKGLLKRFESWTGLHFRRRELRMLRMSQRLQAAGILVPTPIAAWRLYTPRLRAFCIYHILDGIPLQAHWATPFNPVLRPGSPIPDEAMRLYMRTLGRVVRKMHRCGIVHEDLNSGNLIVSESLDGSGDIGIIDLDSAFCPFTIGKRAKFTSCVKSLVSFSWCFEHTEDPLFAEFVDAYTEGDKAFAAAFVNAIRFWRSRFKRDHHVSTVMSWLLCPPPANWTL